MKDLLFVMKLYLQVFATVKSDDECEFEHKQVCGFICQFIEHNMYDHICTVSYAQALWQKLEELYASKIGNNKLFYLTN